MIREILLRRMGRCRKSTNHYSWRLKIPYNQPLLEVRWHREVHILQWDRQVRGVLEDRCFPFFRLTPVVRVGLVRQLNQRIPEALRNQQVHRVLWDQHNLEVLGVLEDRQLLVIQQVPVVR